MMRGFLYFGLKLQKKAEDAIKNFLQDLLLWVEFLKEDSPHGRFMWRSKEADRRR